jgi:hypothetical protein
MFNELGTLNSKPERCKAMNACLLLSLLSIFFPLLFVHAAEDKSPWQVEWGKTVQSAKKEGQLVNYGGEEIIHPEILKAFNKDYPEIKVTTAGGHGSELGARILAERRAGKYLVDLYAGGPTTPYRALYLSKALDPSRRCFCCRRLRTCRNGLPESTSTRIPRTATSSCSRGA